MKIAITQGDTNGVGLEIILRIFASAEMLDMSTFVLYAAPKAASYYRKTLDLPTTWTVVGSAAEAQPGRLNMIATTEEEVKIDMGQPTAESGAAALAALELATRDLQAGNVDALVTAPICKAAIQSDAFRFCGHTEYLADRLSTTIATAPAPDAAEGEEAAAPKAAVPSAPLMILMNDVMRVALVTTHLPISGVAAAITRETIMQKIAILDHSLRQDFLITQPRIAVLGLNPHAGDDGVIGTEEKEIIAPAIAAANEGGAHAYGPYAADGFFGTRAYEHFDGVLAMYHDQGLTAFKALAMEAGINYTAGLSAVRTSPDHGTAYDIAGKGTADLTSFRQAIYTAIDIVRAREAWREGHTNPLPKLYKERREDDRPNRRPPMPKPIG